MYYVENSLQHSVVQALLLFTLTLPAAAFKQEDPLLANHDTSHVAADNHERIAIIEAGIGGASAAFHIQEHNRNDRQQEVTIFEREFNVGGRIQSPYLKQGTGALRKLEDGATAFFENDWCITSAMHNVGLKTKRIPDRPDFRFLLQWNDDDVRTSVKCNAASTAWQDTLYGGWRYRRSWGLLNSAVQSGLEKWSVFGSPYKRPFSNITEELSANHLKNAVQGSASTYLRRLSISPALQNELIRPCSRARLSQELSDISPLSALIAAGNPTRSIAGGNDQLVERMIRLSYADLQLGTVVTAISPGASRRYKLSFSQLASGEASMNDEAEFDVVILATPLQSSDIDLSDLSLHKTVLQPPYIETHVTHFSSSSKLSTNLSDLPLDTYIYGEHTLVNSKTTYHPSILNVQRSNVCFLRYCSPGDECDQCDDDNILYRVHSRQYLKDSDIVWMVGQETETDKKLDEYGIGFVHRRAWPHSYPQTGEGRREYVEQIQIAPDLFYLDGAESIMSSMEMSCRMGRNVAYPATRYGRNFRL